MGTVLKNVTPENTASMLLDKELSLKAKGLLSMLACGMDEPSLAAFIESSSDGMSSVRSAISDAEQAGYLIRERERDSGGKYTKYRWTVDFAQYK